MEWLILNGGSIYKEHGELQELIVIKISALQIKFCGGVLNSYDLCNYYIEYIPLNEQIEFVDKYVKPFNQLVLEVNNAEHNLKKQLQEIL